MITINENPLMTRFLVEQGVFRNDPLVLVDVGARGGIAKHWEVFGSDLRAYCFEPDEVECARLNATAPANVTYIPKALWNSPGKQTLYMTRLADSSGLYKNGDYFNRFVNAGNGEVIEKREINCTTLYECIIDGLLPVHWDFLKLDAEGAELDILNGLELKVIKDSMLGVVTEIRFHPEINGCAPFHAIDNGLKSWGLSLYDLTFGYQSRKDLPYPQRQRWIAQDGKKFYGLTTRGQIQDGDALYFRDLLLPHGKPALDGMSTIQVLKMACLMELYSLNDCAAELLLAIGPVDGIFSRVSHTLLLDLLATGIAGEPTTFADYRAQYFA